MVANIAHVVSMGPFMLSRMVGFVTFLLACRICVAEHFVANKLEKPQIERLFVAFACLLLQPCPLYIATHDRTEPPPDQGTFAAVVDIVSIER